MSREFWNLLFQQGEETCFAPNQYGTTTGIIDYIPDTGVFEFFSINPVQNRRADANVTAFRNILVEFDKMPLAEQQDFVTKIGLPWSTCVFSGSKSFHYIISLADDLPSVDEYRMLVRRVQKACPGCDPNCKNPSRLSRVPGTLRANTGKVQELIGVRDRIMLADLEDWLLDLGIGKMSKYVPPPMPTIRPGDPQWFSDIFLTRKTRHFLAAGATPGERHHQVMLAAYDFARCNKSIEEALERLLRASGLEDEGRSAEVRKTIAYCYSEHQLTQSQQVI